MRAHPNPDRRPAHVLDDLKRRGLPSDYPLTPHRSGQWRARINGKDYYFGTLDDPDAAREQFEYDAPYIEKGQAIPDPTKADRTTLAGLLDRWLDYQRGRLDAEAIATVTYGDYKKVADFMRDKLNDNTPIEMLTPERWTAFRSDIDKTTTSPTVASRYVTIAKMPFKWGWESDIIDRPVRFGPAFKVAKKSAVRKARHKAKARTFRPSEIHKLIDSAGQILRAMILLGINCGMTQAEVSSLIWSDIDLSRKRIDTLRNKTAVKRTAPLWPETLAALKEIPKREYTERVFTTRHGNAYLQTYIGDDGKVHQRDNIAREFRNTAQAAKLQLPAGLGFGKLRHTFRTTADGCRDANAIKRVMGHELGTGAVEATYINDIEHARLKAVTDRVRNWLYKNKTT